VDGQGGTNTLDYAGAAAVSVRLQALGGTTGFSGMAAQIGGTFDDITALVGSPQVDTLTGMDAAATWLVNGGGISYASGGRLLIFSFFENLIGGSTVDIFNMTGDHTGDLFGAGGDDEFNFNVGTLSGDIDGQTGLNTFRFNGGVVSGNVNNTGGTTRLDFSNAGAVTVTLTALGANGFDGNSSVSGNFSDVGGLVGSPDIDTLIGLNAAATFALTGSNSGTYTSTNTLIFSAFENLTGGSALDTFTIMGNHTGNLQGGGGNDIFNFNAGAVSGNIDGGAGNDIFGFNGGGINGDLFGVGGNDVFNFNSGTLSGVIAGGAGNDTFNMNGGVAMTLDGQAGVDSLTFATAATITLNALGTSDGFSGTANDVGAFDNINNVIGSEGADTLVGDFDEGGTFAVTANGAGTYTSTNTLTFGATENLVGAGGVDTFDIDAAHTGDLTGIDGDDIYNINAAVTGTLTDLAGDNTINHSANITGGITTGAGDDTINFNGGSLTGNVAAGAGENTYIFAGGTATGVFTITGNDTWNHVDGVALGSSIIGAGNLTVPNAETGDLIISASGLNLPNLSGFTGHLIIGGTIDTPDLPFDSDKDIVVNTELLTLDSPIITDADATLLAQDIDLNSNIDAADKQVLLIATGDNSGTRGNITGVDFETNIRAGNLILVATNNIQQAENIELELGGGDLVVSIGGGAAAPQFRLLDAVAVTPDADLSGFLELEFNVSGVGNMSLNTQANLDVSQANPASNLIGLEQVAFIDTGLFEEDLSLFGVIGEGVALSLAQCEEAEGCAPDVTDEEMDALIADLLVRVEELERRLLEQASSEGRTEIEEILVGYRNELGNYQAYKAQLQEFYAAEEEEDDGFADEFGEEVDTIESQVATLGGILEVTQRRIDWLEGLKGDPDARARLSEATGIDLTIEALDEIIEATRQEIQFFESQIKLLLEGTEANLDPVFGTCNTETCRQN